MRDALKDNRCRNCQCFHQPQANASGMCVAHPPTPLVVGARPRGAMVIDPKGGPAGGMEMAAVVQSYYPPVSPDHGCRLDFVLRHDMRPAGGLPEPKGPESLKIDAETLEVLTDGKD
jgi:hypothetical protein